MTVNVVDPSLETHGVLMMTMIMAAFKGAIRYSYNLLTVPRTVSTRTLKCPDG